MNVYLIRHTQREDNILDMSNLFKTQPDRSLVYSAASVQVFPPLSQSQPTRISPVAALSAPPPAYYRKLNSDEDESRVG
jgi:hypothetical protein